MNETENPQAQELQTRLDAAVMLAREAGEITLDYYRRSRSRLIVDRKPDGSFVTTADRAAERHLRRRVAEMFPGDGFLGEEDGEQAGTTGRRWIVDPIDGTFSFVHGVPLWGVLIALEVADEPALGVVNLPALNEIIYARQGGGCFWNDAPVEVSHTATLEASLLLSTDFGSCAAHNFGAACDELQRQAHTRRTWGDCYGHVLVATGRADVMLDPVMNLWDCAALLPIVEEAGGTFTDWHGRRTTNGGNAISTNRRLLSEVLSVIKHNESVPPAVAGG